MAGKKKKKLTQSACSTTAWWSQPWCAPKHTSQPTAGVVNWAKLSAGGGRGVFMAQAGLGEKKTKNDCITESCLVFDKLSTTALNKMAGEHL